MQGFLRSAEGFFFAHLVSLFTDETLTYSHSLPFDLSAFLPNENKTKKMIFNFALS